MHHSDVVAVANEAHGPLKAVSFASRVPSSQRNTFPNLSCSYSCIPFFSSCKMTRRKYPGVRGIFTDNSMAKRRLGDILERLRHKSLAATLSFFTAVVHSIVVSALLCIPFLHMTRHKDVAIDRGGIYTGCRIAIECFLNHTNTGDLRKIAISSYHQFQRNILIYTHTRSTLYIIFYVFYYILYIKYFLKIMFCYICIYARIC